MPPSSARDSIAPASSPIRRAGTAGATQRARSSSAFSSGASDRARAPAGLLMEPRGASPSPYWPWADRAAACWPTGSCSLAEHNGWRAQGTSVPGVAQRTGSTVYYIEMVPEDGTRSGAGAHADARRCRYRDRLRTDGSRAGDFAGLRHRRPHNVDRFDPPDLRNLRKDGDGRRDCGERPDPCRRRRAGETIHRVRHGCGRRTRRQHHQRGSVRRAGRQRRVALSPRGVRSGDRARAGSRCEANLRGFEVWLCGRRIRGGGAAGRAGSRASAAQHRRRRAPRRAHPGRASHPGAGKRACMAPHA